VEAVKMIVIITVRRARVAVAVAVAGAEVLCVVMLNRILLQDTQKESKSITSEAIARGEGVVRLMYGDVL
jgi:hypothetical protein